MMIRLSSQGCVNRPFYLINVQKNRAPRDRKFVEQLGSFDPLPNMHNERLVAINFDRLRTWLAFGATPSKPVAQLLGKFTVQTFCLIWQQSKTTFTCFGLKY